MVIEVPYVSLKHTLLCIKLQVKDSLSFVPQYIPSNIDTPRELFEYLKPDLKYKKDPEGVELLQTMQTLMNRNGRGDCDCFTITALACSYYLGFKPLYVVLAGNSALAPSHIYAAMYDRSEGKICAFDLTNPVYNMQRPYKFKQKLLFNI